VLRVAGIEKLSVDTIIIIMSWFGFHQFCSNTLAVSLHVI